MTSIDTAAPQARRPRIVVVGSGFGGLAVVRGLKGAAADITLIDRTNHTLFQPLLYQVATAALSPADIATATRAVLRRERNVTVIMGDVTGVDAVARQVSLAGHGTVAFDMLVLATGAAYSYFGHDDWSEHTLVLKSVDDALAIRRRLLGAFERAEAAEDPAEVARLMTFVVVGGGPTGVELAGSIAELARSTLARDFRRIDPAAARILLFEAGKRLLSAFPQPMSDYAAKTLGALGVTVKLGVGVDKIDAQGLQAGGERVPTATVLWCAGTRARPAAAWLGAAAAKNGAVKVGPRCEVPGHTEIFAIGDVSSLDGADGKPLPGLGAVAQQQGDYVGKLIAGRLAGRADPAPFAYRNLGTMAVIGRSRAVADFGWLRMKGFLAWVAWSLVHLMLLVDFRSRVAVYASWVWSWFTYGRGARLLTGGRTPDQGQSDQVQSGAAVSGVRSR